MIIIVDRNESVSIKQERKPRKRNEIIQSEEKRGRAKKERKYATLNIRMIAVLE